MSLNPAENTTKKQLQYFSDQMATMPTLFLQGLFGKNANELSISEQETVEIDIERYSEPISVDVLRGGDGHANTLSKFSTKQYLPPLHDEYIAVTASQINKRAAGQTPYQEIGKAAKAAAMIVKAQLENVKKIMRAIEKQASDILFDGIVTLTNGDNIDYQRLGTHNITPTFAWTNASGVPITDLYTACTVNRTDGKVQSKMAIFDSVAWDAFISNDSVVTYLDNRRIEPGEIRPSFAAQGAVFQGVIWIGTYRLELYTYDQYYTNSSGTATSYVPSGQVCVLDPTARFDKCFGAVEVLQPYEDMYNTLGVGSVPMLTPGEFVPYAGTKFPKTLIAGVQSAPLLVPHQIDAICNINAV